MLKLLLSGMVVVGMAFWAFELGLLLSGNTLSSLGLLSQQMHVARASQFFELKNTFAQTEQPTVTIQQ